MCLRLAERYKARVKHQNTLNNSVSFWGLWTISKKKWFSVYILPVRFIQLFVHHTYSISMSTPWRFVWNWHFDANKFLKCSVSVYYHWIKCQTSVAVIMAIKVERFLFWYDYHTRGWNACLSDRGMRHNEHLSFQ